MKKFFRIVLIVVAILAVALLAAGIFANYRKSLTEYRKGVLDNGMTYYVGRQKYGGDWAEFMLVQKCGSAVERDGEHGLAHLVEHLLFRSTEHFKGTELVDYVRHIGVAFGPDANAETNSDYTVYRLSDVPLTNPERIDSCLLIMHDWAAGAVIEDEGVAKERNIVTEELRMKGDLQYLTGMAARWEDGTPYSHLPIGDPEQVAGFTAAMTREFYERWYQPQLQAVIVVGDIDPDDMERRIRETFSDIPRGGTEPPVPAHLTSVAGPGLCVFTGDAEQFGEVELSTRRNVALFDYADGRSGRRNKRIDNTMANVMGRRFNQMLKDDGGMCGFRFSVAEWDFRLTGRMSYLLVKAFPDSWEQALATAVRELERMARLGLTQYDMERMENISTSLSYRETANACMSNFLLGTKVPRRNTANQVGFTKRKFMRRFNQIFDLSDMTVSIKLPSGVSPECLPTEERVAQIIADALSEPLEPFRYDDLPLLMPTDSTIPHPGNLLSFDRHDNAPSILRFDNGVAVRVSQRSFIPMVTIEGVKPGGLSAFTDKELPLAMLLDQSVLHNTSGTITTGEFEETYRYDGNDVEQLLKSLYHDLTVTVTDTLGFRRAMTDQCRYLRLQQIPSSHAEKEATDFIFAPDKRRDVITPANIDTLNLTGIARLDRLRKRNYRGAAFNIESPQTADELLPLLQMYLGGLPSTKDSCMIDKSSVSHLRRQSDSLIQYAPFHMPTAKVTLTYCLDGGIQWTDSLLNLSLAFESVLEELIINRIRIEDSNIYTIGTSSLRDMLPSPSLRQTVSFTCHPGNRHRIVSDIRSIISDIAYGDAIAPEVINGFINRYSKKSIYLPKIVDPVHSLAYDIPEVNLNTDQIPMVTPEALRSYSRNLLENGTCQLCVISTPDNP